MTEIRHEHFTIERRLAKCPEHVFSAWSDPGKKQRWFARSSESFVDDFRVGGRSYGAFENDMGRHENETRYFEIVPDALIVYGYSMAMNGRVHSVSLVTLRFEDDNGGTHLIHDERMTLLGPSDGAAGRQHGWGVLLDAMGAELERDLGLPARS